MPIVLIGHGAEALQGLPLGASHRPELRHADPIRTVFLDDGTTPGRAACEAGDLRLMPAGQRVTMALYSAGQITAITLVTLPLPR